jgi:hypothetical protein
MISIYQTVNAHAPAIHWWLAQDPRFGPQLYEGYNPKPDTASNRIVEEIRFSKHFQPDNLDQAVYNVHQESLRQLENKSANDMNQVDCTSDYFEYTKDLYEYPVWSNYFGCTQAPLGIPMSDKLIIAKSTVEESAMFYITQYAFNKLDLNDIEDHSKVWWEDHMLLDGNDIGKWKELWYRDYHNQCIQDFKDGKLQYMWQLNFAHWDLEKALRVYNRESFELDYSWNRLVKEKHDPEDIIAQDSCIQHCKVDHLVVDINWFENTDVILDYIGVSNSDILIQSAALYKQRLTKVMQLYKDLILTSSN